MFQFFTKKTLIYSSALLCIAGCIADFILIYIFGNQIPGYSQLSSTLSTLGISSSPVADQVTVWSVVLGIILIYFAFGFRKLYGKETRITAWLIAIYGFGEGIASGIFRADTINGKLTDLGILHDILGGIGVAAILLFPWVMMKTFMLNSSRSFYRFSAVAGVIGLLSTLSFGFRLDYFNGTFMHAYIGLWQRIFLADYYVYFFVIAFMMLKKINFIHSTDQ